MNPAVLLALVLLADAGPIVRDGDRVIFLGDSITVAHTWTRLVEQYVLTHDGDKDVTFINAGVGGHTAADGLARLAADVLVHRPHIVVVNFGMNDSAYPEGSDGAAFEDNMGALLDRLAQAGVRDIVWADTTPFSPEDDGGSARTRARQERIARSVRFAAVESSRRGLRLARWHQAMQDAVGVWRRAERRTKLVPDRVHPAPAAHALLATAVLRALGYSLQPARVHVVVAAVPGPGKERTVTWDGAGRFTVPLVDVAPPLLATTSAREAVDLGSADVVAVRQIMLSVAGLPPARPFRVRCDDVDVGRFSGAALARGIDLVATTTLPEATAPPAGATMTAAAAPPPSFSACDDRGGNPFVRHHACLWGRLFQKDQLRIAMRAEKTRWLPDFVPDRRATWLALTEAWVHDADASIRARARAWRAAVPVVTLVPEDP
jgi:lysophospholipase L1-like esterase